MTVTRALLIAQAAAWLSLGLLSDAGTHGLTDETWVLLATLAAGSSLAVVRYGTVTAVRTHTGMVTLIAACALVQLLTDGRWRALAVWSVIVLQAATIAALVHRPYRPPA